MSRVRVQLSASLRIDDIYRHTRDRWGAQQADRYVTGLFEAFGKIDTHGVPSRPIPAEFGVQGSFFRYEMHFVYWKRLDNGDIGIASDRTLPGGFRAVAAAWLPWIRIRRPGVERERRGTTEAA